jgi:hypothetical protein
MTDAQECTRARAPAALTKDVLRRAFWKVDPNKTGDVSIQQFLQVCCELDGVQLACNDSACARR